jgi:aldehyde dehydrogenase (NAD+)
VDVKNDMPMAMNETFGPVAPVIRVKGEEDALLVANDTEYGLSSAVSTRDENRRLRFAQKLQAGMSHVNGSSVDDAPTGPFGGVKNSGRKVWWSYPFRRKWLSFALMPKSWIARKPAPDAENG